jgi:hypothetical protein
MSLPLILLTWLLLLFLVLRPEGKRSLGKPKRRWEVRVERYGLDASDSGQGPVAGSCEHDNKHPGSVKGGEFLD